MVGSATKLYWKEYLWVVRVLTEERRSASRASTVPLDLIFSFIIGFLV